jgi:propionyl-CoA synthetase
MSYAAEYQLSMTDPDRFWSQAADGISWIHKPLLVLDDTNAPFHRWFPDGTLNT